MTKNRDPLNSGIVSQCEAHDCTYNQERQCNAGAVYVNFLAGKANCSTYTTDVDNQQQNASGIEAGQVAQCSVIDCFYNEAEACVVDSITVSFLDSVSKCDRYVVSDSEGEI